MEEDSVNDNVPGSVNADEQTDQLVSMRLWNILPNVEERNWWTVPVTAILSNEDTVKKMPSGGAVSDFAR